MIIERAEVGHGSGKRQFSGCGVVRGLHNWRNCGTTCITWDDNNIYLFISSCVMIMIMTENGCGE